MKIQALREKLENIPDKPKTKQKTADKLKEKKKDLAEAKKKK